MQYDEYINANGLKSQRGDQIVYEDHMNSYSSLDRDTAFGFYGKKVIYSNYYETLLEELAKE